MKKMEKWIRSDFDQLVKYKTAAEEGLERDLVLLDANENPFLKDAGINRYPKSEKMKLTMTLANSLGINSELLFIGNGSDEILDLIFRLFIDPYKDKVVLFEPSFGMFETLAKLNRAEIVKIPLSKQFEWEWTPSSIIDAKLIFICSPNNPTGNCISKSNLEELLQCTNGIVVVDEAYVEFSNQDFLSLLTKYENLIISRTFSKAYGAAGIRIGYMIAPPEIIRKIEDIAIPYTCSILNLKMAIRIIELNTIKEEVSEIIRERNRVSLEIKELENVIEVYPSEANFILVRFQDAIKVYRSLQNGGVLVRNRSLLPGCDNCLRITIGTMEENNKMVNILKKIDNEKSVVYR